MEHNTLISGINEWLVDQALGEPDIVEMFEGVCHQLHAIGIPVARARLTWPTLHPLFQAETILWRRGFETEFEQFVHQDEVSEAWLNSPMKYMFDNEVDVLRRHLDGPNKLIDFPVLKDVVEQGMTDYLVIATALAARSAGNEQRNMGIVVTWSSDRPGGFSDSEVAALQRIQRRFAVACKTSIQARIASNITTAYLGQNAGNRVLNGEIRLGDGKETKAVVWYSDLRESTALADTMSGKDFIRLLNVYYNCTAGPVIEAGGEVLDFIGDGVLAIFPYESDVDREYAVRAATNALLASKTAQKEINEKRRAEGLIPIRYGVGLNTGSVMFGNIGVPERLTFSVIGPTVNEVSRIETMTKAVDTGVLTTGTIAALNPELWTSKGFHRLHGISHEIELFTLKELEGQDFIADSAAKADKKKESGAQPIIVN